MPVLAALGDAPTAVIAVLAILIGVFLAARGPREKRAAGTTDAAEEPRPTLLRVPVAAAPETEPGFVGPEGEVVGHGRIRLGGVGALGGGEATSAAVTPAAPVAPEPPAPEPSASEPSAPEPSAPEPSAPEQPAPAPPAAEAPPVDPPAAASEQALFTSPPTVPDVPAGPAQDAATPPSAEEEPPPPAEPREPAWRVAARAANSAVHFRQGAIKVGGKPAKKDQD